MDVQIYKQQALANQRLHEELLESQLKQAGLSARQIKNVKHRVEQIVFWSRSIQRWEDNEAWDSALDRANQKREAANV